MILLLDLGNTSIKWAFLEGRRFKRGGTVLREEHDQLWSYLPKPQAIWISSVADRGFNQALTEVFVKRWHLFPKFAKSQAEGFGVKNGYCEPGRLGVDRWLALIAAFNRYRHWLPALIVDCGTAVTLDLLTADGRHLGGYLLPGTALMIEALLKKAPQVQWREETPKRVLLEPGKSTEEGLLHGSWLAITGAVKRARPSGWHLILTGGGASKLAEFLDVPYMEVPDLVLEGLAVVACEP